jgi:hypothetical protein
MISILSELELCSIDRMSRQELVDALREYAAHLPVDLWGQLEDQPTHRLQLLLLAGRLIRLLRKDTASTFSPHSRREVRN